MSRFIIEANYFSSYMAKKHHGEEETYVIAASTEGLLTTD
jgi:hypothetical protein